MKSLRVYPRWSAEKEFAFEFEKLEVALVRLWVIVKRQKEADLGILKYQNRLFRAQYTISACKNGTFRPINWLLLDWGASSPAVGGPTRFWWSFS